MSKYWVEHETYGCPIGGPFDLWRQNYFMANSEPPEDTAKLYPGLRPETVTAVAVATVNDGATLDDLLARFGDQGPLEQFDDGAHLLQRVAQECADHARFNARHPAPVDGH